MALRPAPVAPQANPTISAEQALLATVAKVESAVDAWLSHKDRSQPHAVPLPRVALDAAEQAELVRRYVEAGWAAATIKDGVLHLDPVRLALPAPTPEPVASPAE